MTGTFGRLLKGWRDSRCKHDWVDVSLFRSKPGRTDIECRHCKKFKSLRTSSRRLHRIQL